MIQRLGTTELTDTHLFVRRKGKANVKTLELRIHQSQSNYMVLTFTLTSFVQEWSDVRDNVHLLHCRNDIGVSEAVLDGTQRNLVDVSTILEKHIMICPKMRVPNDHF